LPELFFTGSGILNMPHKMMPLVSKILGQIARFALRVLVGGTIFMICLTLMSRYLGLPVPDPVELLDKFKDVTKLAEFLS
jgi:hypothetical protein